MNAVVSPEQAFFDSQKLPSQKRGMTFVGTTIMYAYMQAIGMVNDHSPDCFCYKKKRA